ncbi:MAG: hypothetical protein ACP5GX_06565, partial [Anaerolineae bacterium]
FLATLAHLKKHEALRKGRFVLLSAGPTIQAVWDETDGGLYGIFNVSGSSGKMTVQLPDGPYEDLLNGEYVTVKGGRMPLPEAASILRYDVDAPFKELEFPLLPHY